MTLTHTLPIIAPEILSYGAGCIFSPLPAIRGLIARLSSPPFLPREGLRFRPVKFLNLLKSWPPEPPPLTLSLPLRPRRWPMGADRGPAERGIAVAVLGMSSRVKVVVLCMADMGSGMFAASPVSKPRRLERLGLPVKKGTFGGGGGGGGGGGEIDSTWTRCCNSGRMGGMGRWAGTGLAYAIGSVVPMGGDDMGTSRGDTRVRSREVALLRELVRPSAPLLLDRLFAMRRS